MYEELIAELRQHHCDAKEDDTQEVCEECAYDVIIAGKSVPSGIASVCVCGLMNRAADAIEELSKQHEQQRQNLIELMNERPRWIPVTERLPEEDGWYQVYAPSYSGGSSSGLKNIKGNMYSAFKNGKWSIEVGYHKRPGCVKAWMPLPEPPKEE